MNLDFGIVVTSLPHLLKAALLTILITVASQFFGTVCALMLALARISSRRWLSTAVAGYVWIVRGTPMLLHLFFIYYAAPIVGLTLDPLPAAILAMSLSSSAYNSEIFRAGIQAVHHGQIEAARAVGMTYAQTMRRIVLPQAFRIIIPPYMSNFISHTKNSSLASVITVPELMLTAQTIASSSYRVLEVLCAAGLVYLCLTSGLTWLQRYLEQVTAYEKRGLRGQRRRALGLAVEG